MARIQILELPTIYRPEGPDETPFILVIDQVADAGSYLHMADDPERLGARAILLFEDTIELPANQVEVDGQTYPLTFKIAGDFAEFRGQVEEQIRHAQGKVTQALHDT